jgi:Cu/Ag efflux protein CusF
MKPYKALVVGVTVAVPLWAGFAAGQSKPSCDQMKASAPQKVQGRVVRVDNAAGKVTVAAADGKTHEFQASKETLQDLKVGDSIEANLRSLPGCDK